MRMLGLQAGGEALRGSSEPERADGGTECRWGRYGGTAEPHSANRTAEPPGNARFLPREANLARHGAERAFARGFVI